jgi:DNA primase large subunit
MPDVIHPFVAKYPFLQQAKEVVETTSKERLFDDTVKNAAAQRVISAINEGQTGPIPQSTTDNILQHSRFDDLQLEILTYPAARLVVSCIDDRRITHQYLMAETQTFIKRFQSYDIFNQSTNQRTQGVRSVISLDELLEECNISVDKESSLTHVSDSKTVLSSEQQQKVLTKLFGIDVKIHSEIELPEDIETVSILSSTETDSRSMYSISLSTFLSSTHDSTTEWNLTKFAPENGNITLSQSDLIMLIEDNMFEQMSQDLPYSVPDAVKTEYNDLVQRVKSVLDESKFSYSIDRVEEGLFPPVIKQMLADFPVNLKHEEKVTLVGFLLHIGMSPDEVLETLGVIGTPGEDPTRYQVNHIDSSNKNGDPYTPANYSTIESWNYSWDKDALEDAVKNPLSYYTIKLQDSDET